MTLQTLSASADATVTVLLIALMIFALLLFFFYSKGNVRVLLCWGKTKFELEGKEKRSEDVRRT
jgi:hypothetical protein